MQDNRKNSVSLDNYTALIRLETKVDYLTSELKEMKINSNKSIEELQIRKMDSKDFAEWGRTIGDHETRLRFAEKTLQDFKGRYAIIAVLGTAILSGIVSYLVKNY